MKMTVNFSDFCDAFKRADRDSSFTYEGKKALFEGLLEYEDATGSEIELDVIALCCEFTEATWEEIASDYSIDLSDCKDEDEIEGRVMDYLNYYSCIMGEIPGGCVYQQF